MKYGLSLPNGGVCGDARILAELGCLAEQAGWDGVFVEDYIVHQSDGPVPTCDPWIALAAMAVGTSRIQLGTSVTPLSRRRPWKVAREAVALDQLSNGRFILGVGSGDAGEAGFSRVNEARDAKERARILDEALDVIVGLMERRTFQLSGNLLSGERDDISAHAGPAAANPHSGGRRLAAQGPGAACSAL